jgi:hypothetical protein
VSKMTDDQLRKLKANIFPAAWDAVEPVDSFPWHLYRDKGCDSWKPHSSQALAIDVFGTVKQSANRDALMDAVAKSLGLETGTPWEINLEWLDPVNQLREKRRTQVDVMARSAKNLIFFECKFTEPDGGECSQPHPLLTGLNKGKRQCNGNYEEQTNPISGTRSKCALTGKGIRYWEILPRVFDVDPAVNHTPCPFRDSWFQWMRNLTVCSEVARADGLKPAFVLVYADGAGLSMADKVKSPTWVEFTRNLKRDGIVFRHVSYQDILSKCLSSVSAHETERSIFAELTKWVDRKIQAEINKRARG